MRGNDTVIAELNEALREELAINQYFIHAGLPHWGYQARFVHSQTGSTRSWSADRAVSRWTPKMEYLELNIGRPPTDRG